MQEKSLKRTRPLTSMTKRICAHAGNTKYMIICFSEHRQAFYGLCAGKYMISFGHAHN